MLLGCMQDGIPTDDLHQVMDIKGVKRTHLGDYKGKGEPQS